LVGVITVDFDVGALPQFVAPSPLAGGRPLVFARDGTILAAPNVPVPDAAAKADRLLRAADYDDPAILALTSVAHLPRTSTDEGPPELVELDGGDAGDLLAAIVPIGGVRAGI